MRGEEELKAMEAHMRAYAAQALTRLPPCAAGECFWLDRGVWRGPYPLPAGMTNTPTRD